MTKPTNVSFLCTQCRRCMCNDCKRIADEYAELLGMRNRALYQADQEMERMKRELEIAQRRQQGAEEVAKMGYSKIMLGYLDSLIEQRAKVPA